MYRLNTAGQFFAFQGVDATTGGIKSGVTWTVRRCIDGTFAAAGGTATEDGTTGWYKFAMSQADTNGADISFNFTGTGAVPQTVNILTTAANPADSVRFGLTALPNATAGANTGLPVVGTQVPNATAGSAGGLFIAGSNAATTIAGLTTGALSCTTITASGAVAFQSTFAVTTSTSLAALSATTVTFSGAVAFQSTFAVTTSTSLAALSCTTFTASGAVAFQSTFGVTGITTLSDGLAINRSTTGPALVCTGSGITGHGAIFNGATGSSQVVLGFAGANGDAFRAVPAGTGKAINANGPVSLAGAVTLGSTLDIAGATTLTSLATSGTVTFNAFTVTNLFSINGVSDVAQTGDSFARIGATGSGLTSLAPSATALSTAQWTNTLAMNLGTTNATVATNLDTTVSSRSTLTQTQVTGGAYSIQSASCVMGDARVANLDAAVTSRMATYTQSTGFLAATFPTTVASPTNVWASATRTLTSASGLTVDANVVSIEGTSSGIQGLVDMMQSYADNGFVGADIEAFRNQTLTGNAINQAAAFGAMFDVATPVFTVASVNQTVDVAGVPAAWGASVVGNGRTRDYFLQGGTNKVAFDVPGTGQYTIYQTDDSTSLKIGTYTADTAADPVVSLDPA